MGNLCSKKKIIHCVLTTNLNNNKNIWYIELKMTTKIILASKSGVRKKILEELSNLNDENIKVVPGPCMGRCQVAPTVCVGKNYVDNATPEAVKNTIKVKKFESYVPNYTSYKEYLSKGGYVISNKISKNEISKEQIINILNESGVSVGYFKKN